MNSKHYILWPVYTIHLKPGKLYLTFTPKISCEIEIACIIGGGNGGGGHFYWNILARKDWDSLIEYSATLIEHSTTISFLWSLFIATLVT